MNAFRHWAKTQLPSLASGVRLTHGWIAQQRARRSYLSAHLPELVDFDFDAVYFSNSGNHPSAHIRRTGRFIDVAHKSVLCLGCRDGSETKRWAEQSAKHVVGLDYFPSAQWGELDGEMASGTVSFVTGDARRMPFSDGSFDVVSSESLLEHVSSPNECIDEMFRVTRLGGIVFAIFGPLFYTFGGAHFEGGYEHLSMERSEFIDYIKGRNRPIERAECLFYFEHQMFSFWTLQRYLEAFGRFEKLYSAVFVSQEALLTKRSDSRLWQSLRQRYSETDLLVSGLAMWLRRPCEL